MRFPKPKRRVTGATPESARSAAAGEAVAAAGIPAVASDESDYTKT